ncbi:hypothetical protein [Caldimonas thermodepolymerans]|uniref:Uncharacterized protein n=1 Tax=Caldimonas thermodepolymerans TaxID=215580 RepID=A0AA46HV94_9BURK|nr:hypothetical protein [Caldimonas thermodepolymerans]TCP06599.1 hypothetical protein EV676_10682 [Caldimonas thermodepolymerans]UZG49344.1 hypothetical protein ONS87_06915 [Caldimonas thermodepolymerans]
MTKQVRAREWARKEVEFWTDSSGHLTQTPQEMAERGWKAGFEAGRREAAAALEAAREDAERLAEALREAQPFIGWAGSYPELHAKIDALLRDQEEGK